MNILPGNGRFIFYFCLVWMVLWFKAAPHPAQAQEPVNLIGLVAGNVLVRFQATSPGTIDSTITISGLPVGETLVAIDFRPLTGQLYGLGITDISGLDSGTLYLIDPGTGVASPVGTAPFSTTLADGAQYGFDFNPVVDRIRVVNSADENFRLNPLTGVIAGMDTGLNNSSGSEEVVAAAYDRNVSGGIATTLFGIDLVNATLVMQGGIDSTPSPNTGVLTTIGSLGVIPDGPQIGFDIAGTDGVAYTSWQNSSNSLFQLYIINLNTGAATLVGIIGNGTLPIRGLTVIPVWNTFLPYVIK